ncbi:hypothetical protein [Cytobacillus sp. IB215665]|uniref:hypothetical protein n=1 Tax=Cytobacillus sp. IB215665 TaxID=3097357 RepID=UPI002A10B933|nr:hypothetical protein [Cytobacillus sp. IB215665]MDX8367810.1 hypothetical protein [Cytobacillus sp. IB215665]
MLLDEEELEKAKEYVFVMEAQGFSNKEVIKNLSDMYTQKQIAQILDVNVRRVKYLYQKFGIRKNTRVTKKCHGCGEELHISFFNTITENGQERFSPFCSYHCANEYNRNRYFVRKYKAIDKEAAEREIRIYEQYIEAYKDLLKDIEQR